MRWLALLMRADRVLFYFVPLFTRHRRHIHGRHPPCGRAAQPAPPVRTLGHPILRTHAIMHTLISGLRSLRPRLARARSSPSSRPFSLSLTVTIQLCLRFSRITLLSLALNLWRRAAPVFSHRPAAHPHAHSSARITPSTSCRRASRRPCRRHTRARCCAGRARTLPRTGSMP